jgi:hypothetical protein
MKVRALLVGLALAFAAGPALADVIHLSSGGKVRGKIVKETARSVTVEGLGGTTVVPRNEIEKIERGSSAVEQYRKRLARIDENDPDARTKLGKWLIKQRLDELGRRQLQEAIKLDPEHSEAREALGYVRKDGAWVLTGSESASAGAKKPARKARLDAPASQELNAALKAIRSNDAAARQPAWELLANREAEVERLMTLLAGEPNKAQAKLRGFLSRADAAAADLSGEALRPHVVAYVDATLAPAIEAAFGSYANAIQRKHKRALARMESLFGDYAADKPTVVEDRTELVTRWATKRDAALEVIFDLQIYPDANHGRSGQHIVDEHVDAVRPVWAAFDQQIQKDLGRLLNLDPADAVALIDAITLEQARINEVKVAMEPFGREVEVPAVPAACRILVGYRAGHIDWALQSASELNVWEQEMLRRMRAERVRAHNASFKTKSPYKYGVQPSGQEVEQVRITNDYRLMMARDLVEVDPRLVDSARTHSADMTRLGFFAHQSPIAGKESPSQRMAAAGYPGAGGENISLGSVSPMATHIAWYNSSGHHRNILNHGWTAMGSGQDGQHWTQNFGGHATLKR